MEFISDCKIEISIPRLSVKFHRVLAIFRDSPASVHSITVFQNSLLSVFILSPFPYIFIQRPRLRPGLLPPLALPPLNRSNAQQGGDIAHFGKRWSKTSPLPARFRDKRNGTSVARGGIGNYAMARTGNEHYLPVIARHARYQDDTFGHVPSGDIIVA